MNTKGISSFQVDLGIEVILELFSEGRLRELFQFAYDYERIASENTLRIYASREDYFATIDSVILFLQGRNQTLARQICAGNFLPQAERFNEIDQLDWAFGSMGMLDKAKHLATLYIEDISDFIIECVDEHFGFSRYAERLGESANDFDELYSTLNEDESIIDQLTLHLLDDYLQETEAKLVCISAISR